MNAAQVHQEVERMRKGRPLFVINCSPEAKNDFKLFMDEVGGEIVKAIVKAMAETSVHGQAVIKVEQ
jgi:hypothetical protein